MASGSGGIDSMKHFIAVLMLCAYLSAQTHMKADKLDVNTINVGASLTLQSVSPLNGYLNLSSGLTTQTSIQINNGALLMTQNDTYIRMQDSNFNIFVQPGPRSVPLAANSTLTWPDVNLGTSTPSNGYILAIRGADDATAPGHLLFYSTGAMGVMADSTIIGNGGNITLPTNSNSYRWINTVNSDQGVLSMAAITSNRAYLMPDASGTVALIVTQDCGSTSGATQLCAGTVKPNWYSLRGVVVLNSAATQSITGLPFASSASYSCHGSNETTAAGIVSFNTYAAASVTIQESGGTTSDHLRWACEGF